MNKGTAAAALAALLAGALLTVPACHPAGPGAPPLEGARIGGPFTLTDQDGRPFPSTRLAGRYRIMYFGYTFCPDVCPTDMQVIAAGVRQFAKADPARGAKVVPVFVTVDPARDTAAVVKQFVANFPPAIGLTGTPAQIAAVAKQYAVLYKAEPPAKGATGYLVDHSRTAILFAPDGKPIALMPQDVSADAVAAELAKWVR